MLAPVSNTGAMKQTVEALNIDCAKPAGAVSVTITPGHTKLALLDDGRGADRVAGDGIYSASWTPACGAGPFTFTFADGASYPVDVTACIALSPVAGPPGTPVTVTGSGYAKGDTVDVFFDRKLVATVDADSAGRISATIVVPQHAAPGAHLVTASGQASGVASDATFTVTAASR
jgi:hypothetical protein